MCVNLPNPHGSPQHLGRVCAGAVSASTGFLTSLGCGFFLCLSASAWLLPELGFTLLIASELHPPHYQSASSGEDFTTHQLQPDPLPSGLSGSGGLAVSTLPTAVRKLASPPPTYPPQIPEHTQEVSPQRAN